MFTRYEDDAVLEPGTVVVAMNAIIEGLGIRDPNAKPYDEGFVHAEPLELGIVLRWMPNETVDVRFVRTGTSCTCTACEFAPVYAEA